MRLWLRRAHWRHAGPRLASNGFVVIVIDTLSPTNNAEQRAVQLIAALNQVIAFSATVGHPLLGRVDGNRLGVMGHSYGGGGALLAGTNNPSLKAVIPLAPYYESTSFPWLTVATLVVGCQRDVVAPVAVRAFPMYESIPASVSKATSSWPAATTCASRPATATRRSRASTRSRG